MAGKFAINGKVVRTSKTHDYTHAVCYDYVEGQDANVWACSGSYELAVKSARTIGKSHGEIVGKKTVRCNGRSWEEFVRDSEGFVRDHLTIVPLEKVV